MNKVSRIVKRPIRMVYKMCASPRVRDAFNLSLNKPHYFTIPVWQETDSTSRAFFIYRILAAVFIGSLEIFIIVYDCSNPIPRSCSTYLTFVTHWSNLLESFVFIYGAVIVIAKYVDLGQRKNRFDEEIPTKTTNTIQPSGESSKDQKTKPNRDPKSEEQPSDKIKSSTVNRPVTKSPGPGKTEKSENQKELPQVAATMLAPLRVVEDTLAPEALETKSPSRFFWFKSPLAKDSQRTIGEPPPKNTASSLEKYVIEIDKKGTTSNLKGEELGGGKIPAKLPRKYKIYWALYTTSATVAVTVSLIFWAMIYDPEVNTSAVRNHIKHTVNSVFIFMDLAVIKFPLKAIHFYFPALLALAYGIFSFIYQQSGGVGLYDIPIYPIMDWRMAKKTLVVYICVYFFTIIVHLMLCFLSVVKFKLFRKISHVPGPE